MRLKNLGDWLSRVALIALVSMSALLLSACKSPPSNVIEQDTPPSDMAASDIADLLEKANQSPPDIKLTQMIDAAERLIQAGEIGWARSVIENIPPVFMMFPEYERNILYARTALIKSRIEVVEGSYQAAFSYVNEAQIVNHLYDLPPESAFAVSDQRAELLFELGDLVASIRERALLAENITLLPEHGEQNNQLIWQALMELPNEQLTIQKTLSDSYALKGWYTLALLNKKSQNNLSLHVETVEAWVRSWPDHPASLDLPADLKLLRELLENQPQKVAVILPLTGKIQIASNSIVDGIMAGFYQSQAIGAFTPEIVFYDSAGQDINFVYDSAVQEGADFIIGPLTKTQISELALRPELPIPTLALNQIKLPLGHVANLFQFGLGVEDEAKQSAEKIQRDGHRSVITLAPNTLIGDRSDQSFKAAFGELTDGKVNTYRFYDTKEFSNVVKQALHIDQSDKRALEMRQMLGNIEFEPRRRQDVDAIFLSADASQARLLKPILEFHFAGDLPVYATNSVFDGSINTTKDKDLNGIMFTAMPWHFKVSENTDEKTVKKQILNSKGYNPKLSTFYALGVDCFYLYPRVTQLQQIKNAQFYGQTGRLTMNDQGEIERTQLWAQYASGKPKLIKEYTQ